ncbi:helix-turn-helix transcriptional regulator [Agromyces sp. Soil535]|uniref:helix-turn-helix domain-containing protein n=1 Tax=Agromyces sp. Soil535 TaxID=1736390 RepID=UPI000B200D4B|nr:helix-turn-helix transcriptional regulator [Agromyces sp. Soil535]
MTEERTYRRWPDEVGSDEGGPEGVGPEGTGPGGIGGEGPAIDVPGLVMRVRRTCDLRQRDLGNALGLDQSQVARIESARRRIGLPLLARILALADLRIAVLDRDGVEVVPVPHDVLRDNAGRRMPAHLDVRVPSDRPVSAMLKAHHDRPMPQAWYHHRPERDRRRVTRDAGAIDDQPTLRGLALLERDRRAARTRDVRQRAAALLELDCSCSSTCWERRACADACTCRCEQ